jgi:aminopeptidase-like protein
MKDFLSKTANLNRSIVSEDFEKTLDVINQRIPLIIHKYPTGTECFGWILPKKWIIRDAYIKNEAGEKILDWKKHPLHVIIGSLPVKKTLPREELFKKIYVADDCPDSIPYQFKFYDLDWGFCMSKNQRDKIQGNSFEVFIDSEYVDDNLLVGEYIIKGKSEKSIIMMAHIDHPAQVNDGLAGAAVLIKLAEQLKETIPEYTLRFQFLPERIGSIAYLHHNYKQINNILGGIFCDMPGTPNLSMALQYSKWKDSRIDRVAEYVLKNSGNKAMFGNCFEHVVNDDGFYNSPGVDIPCISLSRSEEQKNENNWRHFPFYHTSGDSLENFDFTQAEEFLSLLSEIIFILNEDRKIIRKYIGVPHLSRYNLWVDRKTNPKLSNSIEIMLCDFNNRISIFDICEKNGLDFKETLEFIKKLENAGLIKLEATDSIWFNPENSFEKLASREK